MEVEYVAACEATMDAVWHKKFLVDLGVMRIEQSPIMLFWDNNGEIAHSKEPINYGVSKELLHKILVHNPCSLKLWIIHIR
jgi:hypothetical protein